MTVRQPRARSKGRGKAGARTKRARPRAAGKISAPRPDWFVNSPYLVEAGVPVTVETATQVSAVYGCCRLIVDSLAAAPVVVYEMQSGGRREILHDDPIAYVLNYGASVASAPDSISAQAIEECLFWSALGHGNGYAEIQRDLAGRFFALWPVESERVRPRRDEDGFHYEVTQPEGGTVRVPPADMFRVPGPALHGWVGDSTIYRAAKAIGIAQAAQVFSGAYFANGTIISGVLQTDKVLTEEQKRRAIDSWNEQHKGPKAAHGIAVTGQGLKYQPITHDAKQAQLVESRRFQVQEVARFFGVPTTLLADTEAWTNLSELYLGFYRNALLPWAERFDAEATRKLFPQRQPWREVQHDLTRLTLGTFKDLVAALQQATGGPFLTRNEARAMAGKNTMPGGDKLPDAMAEKAPAPEPAEEPDEEDGEDEMPMLERRGAGDVAKVAVALDRFARRMAARRADLERHNPEVTEANLAEERAKQIPTLVMASGLTGEAEAEMRITKAADAVLAGEPAHLAAERLMQ